MLQQWCSTREASQLLVSLNLLALGFVESVFQCGAFKTKATKKHHPAQQQMCVRLSTVAGLATSKTQKMTTTI